jgi:hypothetical protein
MKTLLLDEKNFGWGWRCCNWVQRANDSLIVFETLAWYLRMIGPGHYSSPTAAYRQSLRTDDLLSFFGATVGRNYLC